MKSLFKKLSIGCLSLVVIVVVLFLVIVGPWPIYKTSNYKSQKFCRDAISAIQQEAKKCNISDAPGKLQAGWAVVKMTPKVGTPLGGYGARMGKGSTGVRDDLHVRALALSDGADTAVLVGSDMIIIPPNIADLVRKEVASKTPLTSDNIHFSASHTHCGPGAFGPGLAANATGGKYDPSLPPFLAKQFSEAIVTAYQSMEPARLASGSIDAQKYVHNRVKGERRSDPELSVLLVEQEDGDRCVLTNFGAHPTLFDDDMMEFSAEWPGAMMKNIEQTPRTTAIYMGGAIGSASPSSPEAPDASGKVEATGAAFAQLVADALPAMTFEDYVDIASLGVPVGMPPSQMRVIENSPKLRLSPILVKMAKIPAEGWIQMTRIGNIFIYGVPFDLGAEVSVDWKAWAAQQGVDLWTTSFSGSYCGYLVPTQYYYENPLDYENGLMSWFGPDTEAYYTDLLQESMKALRG